ncbi:hypothetical protein CB1_000310010 [Camelus ferus]|nr:hypothetical protein CB1_000310010 [Camelus ferus]
MRDKEGHAAPGTRERRAQWEEGASRTSTCRMTSRRRGGRRANGRPSRAGAGPGGIGLGRTETVGGIVWPPRKGFTPAAPVLTNKEDPATQTNLGFIHAFVAAISVIIVSELGDKTFFIAAIMAMRYNRLTVLAGAMLALGLMTCLSVLFGYATTVIPRVYTYYVSTALFAIFGIRMLREGLKMSPDEGQEELEEVQAELKKKDEEADPCLVTCWFSRSAEVLCSCLFLLAGCLVGASGLLFSAGFSGKLSLVFLI